MKAARCDCRRLSSVPCIHVAGIAQEVSAKVRGCSDTDQGARRSDSLRDAEGQRSLSSTACTTSKSSCWQHHNKNVSGRTRNKRVGESGFLIRGAASIARCQPISAASCASSVQVPAENLRQFSLVLGNFLVFCSTWRNCRRRNV